MKPNTQNSKTNRNIIENYLVYLTTINPDIEKITIKNIIPILQVSKGTFYRYFDGIDDLNKCSLHFVLASFLQAINNLFISTVNNQSIDNLALKLNFMKTNYRAILLLYDEVTIEEKLFTYIKEEYKLLPPHLYLVFELFSLIKNDEDCYSKDIVYIFKKIAVANKEYMDHFKGVIQ